MTGRTLLYRNIRATFGQRVRPLSILTALQARETISAATLHLDQWIYPGIQQQPIDRPIFIVGNPRSGTTFLHRLLLGADGMAAFELWEMMFPAITARRLLNRFVPRMEKLSPARYHPSDIHDTDLRGIETDDVAWFLHTLDGPFAWTYFHAWRDTWGSPLSQRSMGIAGVNEDVRSRFFDYYDGIWRRNLQYKGKQRILAKTSMLTFRIDEVLERYPDAKLVYVVRDPVETIPSGLSLLAEVLTNSFNAWQRTTTQDQQRWVENLYQASLALLRAFDEARLGGRIPERNLCVVRYTDLITDLEATMTRILKFIEIDPAPEYLDEVRTQAQRQTSRTSRHEHSPERFGLDPERIRRDTDFVYRNYGLDPAASSPATS